MIDNKKLFGHLFSSKIKEIQQIDNLGCNNQVFKLLLSDGSYSVVKKYVDKGADGWNRGETEFKALKYLRRVGFHDVPEPRIYDSENRLGVYSFEEGEVLSTDRVTLSDARLMGRFLAKLHTLKDFSYFSPARSACLSIQDYVDVLDRRLKTLNIPPESDLLKKSHSFLISSVVPAIEKAKKKLHGKFTEDERKRQLENDEQVLTPADFGFHHAIRKSSGNLVFIDFEYFGRDDPARQLLDFKHHDKNRDAGREIKATFFEAYNEFSPISEELKKRMDVLDPIVGITWTLIYLNTLSKQYLTQASSRGRDISHLVAERLIKANNKLEEVLKSK